MTYVCQNLQTNLKKSFMIRFKVRRENGNLIFYFEEDMHSNSNRSHCVPTAFFEAAYPQYAADKKKKEKED